MDLELKCEGLRHNHGGLRHDHLTIWSRYSQKGVSNQIKCPPSAGPYTDDCRIFGSMLGPRYLRKPHVWWSSPLRRLYETEPQSIQDVWLPALFQGLLSGVWTWCIGHSRTCAFQSSVSKKNGSWHYMFGKLHNPSKEQSGVVQF